MKFKYLTLGSLLLGAGAPAFAQTPPAPVAEVSAPAAANTYTLPQAIEAALQNSSDLLNARLTAESALQDKILARSVVLPQLNFNASFGRTRDGGGQVIGTFTDPTTNTTITQVAQTQIYGSYTAGLNLSWKVFDGGKWWNNLDAADFAIGSQNASAEESKLQTTFLVEQAFYALMRAQKQLTVLTDAAARSRDQAEFTQKLFEGGRSSQADVYAARANRDNDEVNRLTQEALVESSRFDLATAMGLDPSQPLAVVEPPGLLAEPRTPPAVSSLVEHALSTRPSIKAASLQADAQRKSVQASKGDYLPSVTLNAGYNRASRDFPDIVSDPTQKSSLSGSINLNWNLFGGFATDANVAKAQLQLRQLENTLAAGRRGVASDVEKAWANLVSARSRTRVAQQAEDTARESLRLAKTRQQVGVGTQLEVRDAELKLTQAELARLNALLDGRVQEAALRRATGDSI
ncbi:MAG: TolC family protein [Deltaproteobacteria bacterium]|nr:TolC family protein [Deltaproteobacteria bacterium]